jgi:hypothetical protein
MQPQYTRAFHERFWLKVDRNGPIPDYAPHLGPCWIWVICAPEGYGSICHDGFKKAAHRVSWEMENGPIPTGLVLDHLCRVHRCVNPNHLEPVTHAENIRRGISITLDAYRNNVCVKGLHSLTGDNVRKGSVRGRRCRSCERDARRSRDANRDVSSLPLVACAWCGQETPRLDRRKKFCSTSCAAKSQHQAFRDRKAGRLGATGRVERRVR